MPFTFAHPAAVIPLYRAFSRHTVLSALIIGSITPDFQNFLPLAIGRRESHSIAGLFWFCLPVGMCLYLIFHLLMKRALGALCPPSIAVHLPNCSDKAPLLPRVPGIAIVASLLLGAATHLLWDALTHYGYLTVFVLPPLSAYLFSVGEYHVYPYKILQHASTVAGTALLWRWCSRWRKAAPVKLHAPAMLARRERRLIIGTLLLAPPVIGLGIATQSLLTAYGVVALKDFVREAVVTGISAFGLLLFAYCVFWHAFFWRHRRIDD